MTPEEQKLAILKACGWKPVGAGNNWFWKDGEGQVDIETALERSFERLENGKTEHFCRGMPPAHT